MARKPKYVKCTDPVHNRMGRRKVKFSIDAGEPFCPLKPFFNAYPQAVDALLANVEGRDENFVFETMTVKGLLELVGGGWPSELRQRFEAATVAEAARLIRSLREGLDRFTDFMERTKPPVTVNAKKISSGTLKGNLEEAVLWTLREAFDLHGLEDAQKLTVYEYMVARKQVYNDAVVAYNREMAAASASSAARR